MDYGNDTLLTIAECIRSYLTSNDIPCSLRLVGKAMTYKFQAPFFTTIRLSQPVPHHAFCSRWGQPDSFRDLNPWRRSQLLLLTARSGSNPNLRLLLAQEDQFVNPREDVLAAAASEGRLELCEWLRQRGFPLSRSALDAAAQRGQQAACEWLLASGCPWSRTAPAAAAAGGHVALLDWLLQQAGAEEDENGRQLMLTELLRGAARGCDLATLQRLHGLYWEGIEAQSTQDEWSDSVELPVVEAAASSSTPDWKEKAEWLLDSGHRWSPPGGRDAYQSFAASADWQERLHWILQQIPPDCSYAFTSFVFSDAAAAGNVDALELLVSHEAGCQAEGGGGAGWEEEEVGEGDEGEEEGEGAGGDEGEEGEEEGKEGQAGEAGEEGREGEEGEEGREGEQGEDEEGGGGGSLLQDGTPVAEAAARAGHVSVLHWVYSLTGDVDDAAVAAAAARGGHIPVLDWLVELLGPDLVLTTATFDAATESDSVALLAWLRDRGCPWHVGTFFAAVERGSEAQLEWLAQQGCPMGQGAGGQDTDTTGELYFRAAMTREAAMLDCLLRVGCPWHPEAGLFSRVTEALVSGYVTSFVRSGRHRRRDGGGSSDGGFLGRARPLRWLVQHGCPMEWSSAVELAEKVDMVIQGPLHAIQELRRVCEEQL